MSLWYDRAKGRYCIRIVRRGHEVRETCPEGTSKPVAQERHDRLARELYERVALGKQPPRTLSEALLKYLEDELTEGTTKYTNAESNVRALLPFVKGRRLDEISDVAAAYRREEGKPGARKRPLRLSTINRRLALLRRVARLAYRKWEWLPKPVEISVEDERHLARHLYCSRGEIELAAWLTEQWCEGGAPYVLIAAYTGMRQGNVFRLNAEPGLVRDGLIWLPPRVTKQRAPQLIPIAPRIAPEIDRWRAIALPHKRTLYEAYKRAMAAIGRPEVTYHDLRHSTASLLIQAGVPLYEVGKLLGHADMRTTARYAHLEVEYLRGVMARFAPAAPTDDA